MAITLRLSPQVSRHRRIQVWFAIILGALLGSAVFDVFAASNHAKQRNELDWSRAETLTIRMEEYRFIPDHLTLRKGIPYRHCFVNAGKEIYEFTAPDFFQAAVLRNPEALAPYTRSQWREPKYPELLHFAGQKPSPPLGTTTSF